MGTKANPAPNDCYEKAKPDEPIFTLRGHDPDAPAAVIKWAAARCNRIAKGELPPSELTVVQEAYDIAEAMRQYRREELEGIAAQSRMEFSGNGQKAD